MSISLFVATLLSISIKAQTSYETYEVIVQQDSSQCYFTKATIEGSGGNQGNPTDSCYSNIGTFNAAKQDAYRDDEGKFGFRLTYYQQTATAHSQGVDIPSKIELVWTQSSWITNSEITGADVSQIPNLHAETDGTYFHGLGRTTASTGAYLDGTPGNIHGYWFTAVVSYAKFETGIPSVNGASAISNKLEILVPEAFCLLDANICGRIDGVNTDLNGRIDQVNDDLNSRIDTLRDYLKGADAAHSFNSAAITDNKNIFGDSFVFSKTELFLFCINIFTIVFGLFICWRGGLFSKNNNTKVSRYYESDDVDKPIYA